MTASGELAHIDLTAPDFRPDHPDVHAARAAHWCAHTPMGLAVLRHDILTRLLSDRRFAQDSHLLLDAQGITEGPLVDWMRSMLLSMEGPDHTQLRRLVGGAFTPKAVTAMRPRMRRITHELVDAFPDRQVEMMDAFADPYPARDPLGVPAELRETVRAWANDLGVGFSYTVSDHRERIEVALTGVFIAADVLLDARRARPGDDLLSALLAAGADGERLSRAELRSIVATLLFAGHDITRHQLGRAVTTFLRHPDEWAQLAEHPQLAGQAVHEGVRFAPTPPITGRNAICDEIDGVEIPASTHLSMFLVAGNPDPAAVDEPDRVEFTAVRPAPLTFGAGLHYCLGAALARGELVEALPILARRPGPIAPDGAAVWRRAFGITGPFSLPIRFGGAG